MDRDKMRKSVIDELYKIATADITAYVEVDGEGRLLPTPTARLRAKERAAISHIREGKSAVEIKPYDKLKALELLGKHLGLWSGAEPDSGEDMQAAFEEVFSPEDA